MVRAVVASLLLPVLLELLLRLVVGLGDPVVYQSDPDCGYLPAPNQHVKRMGCRNDINAFGMRSPPVESQKRAGLLRALFLGDSVTYGTTHVDQGQIFTSLVGPELKRRLGREVEVLNASAGAWAIGNEWGYLRSRGTFGADVVIFVLNTGDFTQPFNRQSLVTEMGYPDHKPLLAMQEAWERYLRPRLLGLSMAVDAGSMPSASADDAMISENLSRLEQARELILTAGGHLGIVYSPAIGPGWDEPAQRAALARFKQWAAEETVEFLDLTPVYTSHPHDEIFQDAIHLKPAGNELVSRAICDDWPGLSGQGR